MLKIGLTGGIGSGKSLVCSVFKALGVPVFESDQVAKELMEKDPLVVQALISKFGTNIFDKGILNRSRLASLVFNNREELDALNNIVHPPVRKHFLEWCKENEEFPYIIKEAAILFETGTAIDMDKIILVVAEKTTRIRRVMERDSVTEDIVIARMQNQADPAEHLKLSDYLIYNDQDSMILPQIVDLHRVLLNN